MSPQSSAQPPRRKGEGQALDVARSPSRGQPSGGKLDWAVGQALVQTPAVPPLAVDLAGPVPPVERELIKVTTTVGTQ